MCKPCLKPCLKPLDFLNHLLWLAFEEDQGWCLISPKTPPTPQPKPSPCPLHPRSSGKNADVKVNRQLKFYLPMEKRPNRQKFSLRAMDQPFSSSKDGSSGRLEFFIASIPSCDQVARRAEAIRAEAGLRDKETITGVARKAQIYSSRWALPLGFKPLLTWVSPQLGALLPFLGEGFFY